MSSGKRCLDAALDYRGRGWSVVPVAPHGKRPLIRWEPLQHERATDQDVRGWFQRWPDANVAVVTGAISGIVVIDIDPGHGGAESLADLIGRHGVLPKTIEAATGGGGRHIYFRHPGIELRNRTGLAPGIDVRGDGGVVVVPPSVHPSGKRYSWRAAHDPGAVDLAAIPNWLLRLCLGDAPEGGHPAAYWRALARDGVAEGARNSTLASLTGHLLFRGVDPEVARELLLCWNRVRCRPPLDDDEVARTVASITRTHRRAAAADDGTA